MKKDLISKELENALNKVIDHLQRKPNPQKTHFGSSKLHIELTWTPNFGHLVEVDIMKKVII